MFSERTLAPKKEHSKYCCIALTWHAEFDEPLAGIRPLWSPHGSQKGIRLCWQLAAAKNDHLYDPWTRNKEVRKMSQTYCWVVVPIISRCVTLKQNAWYQIKNQYGFLTVDWLHVCTNRWFCLLILKHWHNINHSEMTKVNMYNQIKLCLQW